MPAMNWLPKSTDWVKRLDAATRADEVRWDQLVGLANESLDFLQVAKLDKRVLGALQDGKLQVADSARVRMAILGASTLEHLAPGLRIAAMRWGMQAEIYFPDYAQYYQELLTPGSGLHSFAPQVVVCAMDPWHLLGQGVALLTQQEADDRIAAVVAQLRGVWKLAREAFGAQVIQPSLMPVFPVLMGNNEHRFSGVSNAMLRQINAALRIAADEEGVDILALDDACQRDGLGEWHDTRLWLRAKQYVSPAAAPMFGELVARLVAARRGATGKCLVLDLDNTLWGGVIGDDGLERIVLGQGSAEGEAFIAFQRYALELSRRGIILAVCSKNDDSNARLPFQSHPEMVLRTEHIACFVANWDDKASNLRSIAQQLNIGVDALVFADDNPFERNLVRRELPMVRVPELPEDPALYVECVAGSGYFESLALTAEDRERANQYQANQQRELLRSSQGDLAGYLASLAMVLEWAPFNATDQARIVQLINKTNQFNLTTRRHGDAEVEQLMTTPGAVLLSLRLSDTFGDNGIISIIVALPGREADAEWIIDTWLMSCRVLGRGVEQAALQVLVEQARKAGAKRLVGQFRPTAKNGMVAAHYEKLGFSLRSQDESGSDWVLELEQFKPGDVPMQIRSKQ